MKNSILKIILLASLPLIIQSAGILSFDYYENMLLDGALFGWMEGVVNALNHSANIDARTKRDNWTPLHLAACNGHTEIVDMLIKFGATIDAREDHQWTPLHNAARHGHIDAVNLLLKAGADSTLLSKDDKTIFEMIKLNPDLDQNQKNQLIKVIKVAKDHTINLIEKEFFQLRELLNISPSVAKIVTEYTI